MTAQQPLKPSANLSPTRWGSALLAVALAYFLVFVLTRDQTFLGSVMSTARNALSLAATAVLAVLVLRRWVLPLGGVRLWLAHGALALAFTFTWLWLLTVAVGIFNGASAMRFSVVPFLVGPAETWQLLQGLFAYTAVAALLTLELRPSGALIILDEGSSVFRDRFLVRSGERIAPLRSSQIVSITGADDYAELVTTSGTELVSTTLAEFETALDPGRFLRVHRSAIANLDQVVRAEPTGGGRMILHMQAGPPLPVSRTGAKLLRERTL